MLRILVSAYACSPEMGSEPGMAWNWCSNLAKYCTLYIITEGEFQDKINKALPSLPASKNMIFIIIQFPMKYEKCVGIKAIGGFINIIELGNGKLMK